VGSSRLVEQAALRRRPARRSSRGFGLGRVPIQVGEDLLDHLGRDDSHRPTTGRAGLDVDTEYPFQALRLYALWVRVIEARRSAGVGSSLSPVAAR
jgi:hypothetical protein